MDTDQDTWTIQNTKVPAASRIRAVIKAENLLDDSIESFYTDAGFLFIDANGGTNQIRKKIYEQGIQLDFDYIDAETFREAQEQWRQLEIKKADSFYTKTYFKQSEEAVKKGLVNFDLVNNEDFRIIYDEILYTKGINVIEKPMPPLVMTGQQMHDEFINGDYYAGHGIYGRGTYTDTNVDVAVMYANQSERVDGFGEGGVVQAIKLEKGTRMPSQETVSEVARQVEIKRMEYYNRYQKGRPNEDKIRTYRELSQTTELDVGRTLAAMGYQAYDVSMLDGMKTHIVILDRTAVTVAEKPVYINGEYTG